MCKTYFYTKTLQASSAYCATLAHKTNHSFLPNSQFVVFDHPKYGLIPCLATIADIQQGEEVRLTSTIIMSMRIFTDKGWLWL